MGNSRHHISRNLFFLFDQILTRRQRLLGLLLRPLGVAVPEWRVITVLSSMPGIPNGQLASLTGVDRTTLTRTVERMVQSGLVQRTQDAADQRVSLLRLTKRGEVLFERTYPLVDAQNRQVLSGLSRSEVAQVRRSLHTTLENLKAVALDDDESGLRNVA